MKNPFFPLELSEKISDKISDQILRPGLYIVSTPIGNIFDITFRAIYILQKSKCIFAEDTRVTRKLMQFYGINSEIVSCNDHNETKDEILDKILKYPNEIFSLVSDAGTPLISDPGYKLINRCLEKDIKLYTVPGACSAISGLSISGMPSDEFHFFGFLPNKKAAKIKSLERLKLINSSIIFFESANRITSSLSEILNIFGDRQAYIGRELTKLFEEHKRGKLSDLINFYNDNKPSGEIVIIIDKPCVIDKSACDAHELMKNALEKMSTKDAVLTINETTGIPKNILYKVSLEIKNDEL